MARWLPVLAVAILMGASVRAEDDAPRPGHLVSQMTSGGHAYALYLPRDYKTSEPVSLLVMVEFNLGLPTDRRRGSGPVPWSVDCAVCFVSLRAHLQEGPSVRTESDPERYLLLLEHDLREVTDVLDHVEAHVSVGPGGIGIMGIGDAAEAAVALALRLQGRVTCAATSTTHAGLIVTDEGVSRYGIVGWRIVPAPLDPAVCDLPIILGHLEGGISRGGVHDPESRFEHELAAALREGGLRRVSVRSFTKQAEVWGWFLEHVAEAKARREAATRRDDLLEEAGRFAEKGNLTGGMRRWRDARDLESEHGLEPLSEGLYPRLAERGRAQLDEAADWPSARRRARLRKVARLFESTPLADETRSLLEAIR